MRIEIRKSKKKDKKLQAIISNGKTITRDFGQRGAPDFTKTRDEAQKARYLKRHKTRENWNDPTTPGALSRHLLWNKPTLQASARDMSRRFGVPIKIIK